MFISACKAIILGIVEGLTEFLPISSTGHLILINQWISFDMQFTELFDIVIQLGAILAVIVYFWKELSPLQREESERKKVFELWKKSIIAVIPALFAGALAAHIIEEKLFNPIVVAIMLFIGGGIIIFIEKIKIPEHIESIENISVSKAFCIGLIQCIALVPGVSRAATTIIGARLLGVGRVAAAQFSFFLAIPTMIAASAYSLLRHGALVDTTHFIILSVGFIVAFFTALTVIKFFMKYIQRHTMIIFGYYRVILAIIILVYFSSV